MSKITYDWRGPGIAGDDEPPGPGDTLICHNQRGDLTGTAYLILTARQVNRREPVPGETRMRYEVERVAVDEAVRAYRWEGLVWHHR